MLYFLLKLFFYGCLLIFGVFVSASFSGIDIRKNYLSLIVSCIILILIQALSFGVFNYEFTEKAYPLITHLPLALILIIYYKQTVLQSVYAVLATYLCCQISKWIGILSSQVLGELWFYYVFRIAALIFVGVFLGKYISPIISTVLSKSKKIIVIFGILPFTYYIYDYITVVYSDFLYSGSTIACEFLPFILSLSYLLFCVLYFNEYEQKSRLEEHQRIMEIQISQSMKEVEAIRMSAYETSLLRHDMRHFLNNIRNYLLNSNTESALQALEGTIELVNKTSVTRFCANDLVNTVLSYYKNIMESQQIDFAASVSIGKTLPCPELEFSSILANGLENAYNEVKNTDAGGFDRGKRTVSLELKIHQDKLLLSVKNPCRPGIQWLDGVPQSAKEGHGLGTQSIKYAVEKLKGNCQFAEEDGFFVLRVII